MFARDKYVKNVDLILVVTLFMPVFAEQFASVFLAMVSSVISSNVDTNIINVTSLVSSVISLPSPIYSAIASGGAILMSHAMGAGDTARARRLFTTSMHLGLIISLFIGFCIICVKSPLLRVFYPAMSEEFFEAGEIYAVFAALSFPINFFQTNTIGIMRSCLNTKGAFLISLCVSVVDILMRIVFMIVLDMGIMGLGISIIISKVCSLVICSIIIKKIGIFKGCIKDFKNFISPDVLVDIVKYGAVMCCETFFLALGGVLLNKILADMGDTEITAFNLTLSMESMLTIIPNSLALVAQLVSGRYKGAGENRHALALSMKVTLAAMTFHYLAGFITLPFAEQYARLYTDKAEFIEIMVRVYTFYVFLAPLFWSFGNALSAGIRGYGNVRQPAITLILTLWLFCIPATYFLCSHLQLGAFGRAIVAVAQNALYSVSFLTYYFIELHRIKKHEHLQVE